MEEKICQSCSMPLTNKEEIGTENDGSLSKDYCIYCYRDGKFLEDTTLEDEIAKSADYADQAGITKEEALAYASELFPTLKRWKKS